MKEVILLLFISFLSLECKSQDVIKLASTPNQPGMEWKGGEAQKQSRFGNQIVHNVSSPTLTAYLPNPAIATGTAIVIAPGGGFHMLSIDNEGTDVAKWFVEKGIAAFVLKYRLVPTGSDPEQEFFTKVQKSLSDMDRSMEAYIKLGIDDGLAAISYLRANAEKYHIKPDKIGIVGFSAGGAVAGGAGIEYKSIKDQPNFIAPIYPAIQVLDNTKKFNKDIPIFVAVTGDDFFKFQLLCVDYYKRANQEGVPIEMHFYEKGGHGFGMYKQNLPSDDWINVFWTWMKNKGY